HRSERRRRAGGASGRARRRRGRTDRESVAERIGLGLDWSDLHAGGGRPRLLRGLRPSTKNGRADAGAALRDRRQVGRLPIDLGVAVNLSTWSTDNGHGYVGVQADGHWAPPQQRGKPVRTEFWSEWQDMGNPSPYCHDYWIFVHRTSDGSMVNPANPASTVIC